MEFKDKIKLILKETNPWWKKESFKVLDYRDRDIFLTLERFFKLPQIIALVGLRRTGKTTLMQKIVETFLRQLSSQRILYLSFDDLPLADIEDILEAYKEIFPEIDLRQGHFLFCFDELQKLKSWQEKVKRFYDSYRNIKIIISGSESLFVRKKIKDTLGGRIFEFKISPLTFREYICFTGNEKLLENVELYREDIIRLYRHFLRINGFPELAGIHDDMVIHKYLKESIIDKIVFKDIPQLFNIRDVQVLEEILDIIIFSPGQIIDTIKLSKELGLTRQVVSNYLYYLEKSFLIKRVYNFSRNLRRQKRALKKYYPAVVYPVVIDDKFSACFENSLMWQLDVQFFFRDAYQHEVDAVIVNKNKTLIPIEITTGKPDVEGIQTFMNKYQVPKALIITLDKEGRQKNINIEPFYKCLLTKKDNFW